MGRGAAPAALAARHTAREFVLAAISSGVIFLAANASVHRLFEYILHGRSGEEDDSVPTELVGLALGPAE